MKFQTTTYKLVLLTATSLVGVGVMHKFQAVNVCILLSLAIVFIFKAIIMIIVVHRIVYKKKKKKKKNRANTKYQNI